MLNDLKGTMPVDTIVDATRRQMQAIEEYQVLIPEASAIFDRYCTTEADQLSQGGERRWFNIEPGR